jgi:hypothetical protein
MAAAMSLSTHKRHRLAIERRQREQLEHLEKTKLKRETARRVMALGTRL